MKSTFKQYTNKSSVLKQRSRYVQGGISEITDTAVMWWERDLSLSIPAADDYIINSLPMLYDGRPDLLARDVYGQEGLEWIILQANSIIDINEEFIAGAYIRMPSQARVQSSIIVKTSNSVRNVNSK
jgi:hypothetical protein